MLDNGTWLSATTCYVPYYGISPRGKACIAMGVFFGLTIIPSLMNLKKHGAQFLREDKRFRLVGRRWQWYWMLFVAASGLISLFTGVDIDRYYLQQLPIMLHAFFYTLMVPGALAMVWEGTRHWGSWEERQAVDADVYAYQRVHENGARNVEVYAPLVFYLFAWLNFFLTIPRSWTPVQKQNSPEETQDIARPAATDARNKAGAVLAMVAWIVIVCSLLHTLRVYRQGKILACPRKLFLNILLLAIRLAYGIVAAWFWDVSILNQHVAVSWPFGLGYVPILLILINYNLAGFHEQNEDKQLIAQRVARGRLNNAALNIVKKPNWWKRNAVERFESDDVRLRNLATEVNVEPLRSRDVVDEVEMNSMRQRSASRPVQARLKTRSTRERTGEDIDLDTQTHGETMVLQSSKPEPQQRIKSMLDV